MKDETEAPAQQGGTADYGVTNDLTDGESVGAKAEAEQTTTQGVDKAASTAKVWTKEELDAIKASQPKLYDDWPSKKEESERPVKANSKLAERVALETGVGELKLNVADVNGLS